MYDVKKVNHQVNQIAQKIPAGCRTFILTPEPEATPYPDSSLYHLDAMWAGLQRRLPTLNGYSGSSPIDYPLLNFFKKHGLRRDLEGQIVAWRSRSGLTAAPCRVVFRGQLDAFGQ